MAMPPARFKHASVLGKVGAITYNKAGVLAGGNISFSRMHPWDAKSRGLQKVTHEQSGVVLLC